MKDMAYNQINPIVRIEESKLLGKDLFEKLVLADSFDECKSLLGSSRYSEEVAKDDFDRNFRNYLADISGKIYAKWYEMVPEKELLNIFTMRFTYHNLKLFSKAVYTDQNLDEYWIDDGQFQKESLKSAIVNGTSVSVNGLFMESILEVKQHVENYHDMVAIDIIYDRYFLRHQREVAERLGYQELIKIITTFIDLTNISTLMRGINQQQGENFLTTVLSSYGNIPKRELLEFVKREPKELMDYLLNGHYKEVLLDLIDKEAQSISPIFMNRTIDNHLSKLFEHGRLQAFGPMALVSLLNGQEMEAKNLQLILTGKKHGFSVEQIRERMRDVYGS